MLRETQVLTAKYYRKSESNFPYFSTLNGGQWKQVKPRVKYEHQSFFSTQSWNLFKHLSRHMNRSSKTWQQKMFCSQSHIWTSV